MSIIFGVRKSAGSRVDRAELLRLSAATQAFAPDGTFVADIDCVGLGFQPFHTTQSSRQDSQPAFSGTRIGIVFDGRLDNRSELLAALGTREMQASDASVVLAGFERWQENVFSKLIGDWALALWSKETETLYLARDHAGTRTLYFRVANNEVYWSTFLDTLLSRSDVLILDEEYAAAFLSGDRIGNLTPYRGIRAVPPSHYVVIHGGNVTAHPHWLPLAEVECRRQNNQEYDEQFLTLFERAVARRTALGDPVLAQLSGGMDSTSIVCVSDSIRRSQGFSSTDFLDTVSYYSPSEPNWQEEPFIAATEEQRGKRGIHLDVSLSETIVDPPPAEVGAQPLPGITASVTDFQRRFIASFDGANYRVILSGIGGDELLGGVPTPFPELADYLVHLDFVHLLQKGLDWAIALRTPLLELLLSTVRFTTNLHFPKAGSTGCRPAWLGANLQRIRGKSDIPAWDLVTRLSIRPSLLCNARAWFSIQETFPNRLPLPGPRLEYRYPYLDRDLVDFLLRVPRNQVTKPGRRRALMRRALQPLLPAKVLERKRKAFISRGPLIATQSARSRVESLLRAPLLAEFGWIDATALRLSAEAVLTGRDVTSWPQLMRAVTLELWLRDQLNTVRTVPNGNEKYQILSRATGHPSSA